MTLRISLAAGALLAAVVLVPAAAQQVAPPPAPAAEPQRSTAPCTPADVSTALPLLDRVQRLLDDSLKDAGLGKIELDRGSIDEMRAEIAQIRAAIQPANTNRPPEPAARR